MFVTTIACALFCLPTGEDVVELLLDDERPSHELSIVLSELRPFPVHEIFWMLEGDAIPADWTPRLTVDAELTRTQQGVLRVALGLAPSSLIVPFLEGLLAPGSQLAVESKATIVEILGWVGRVEDLPLLLIAAAPESEKYLVPRSLRKAFGDALGELLAHWPRRVEAELPWMFTNAHSGLRTEVLALVEEAHLAEPIEALGGMLGQVPAFDVLVLHSMHVVGMRGHFDVSDHVLTEVRRFFAHSHRSEKRMACRVAGVLEDVDSISILIRELESPDPNLRAAAAYGLEQCTGLHLDEDLLRWRSWYERDSVWWGNDSRRCFDELANADTRSAMRALKDISGRSMDRKALALGAVPGLDRPELGIVLMTCAFLGRQGANSVCIDLIPLLDHDDASVREAALKALRQITRTNLSGNSVAWTRLVRVLQW